MCLLSHFSHVWLFVTLWTIVYQAPLSMGFARQEYWSGLLCPPSGDLPDPGIKSPCLTSPALAGRFFTTSATWDRCPKRCHISCSYLNCPFKRLLVAREKAWLPRFECWLSSYYMWYWGSYLIFLNLGFLICKMGKILTPCGFLDEEAICFRDKNCCWSLQRMNAGDERVFVEQAVWSGWEHVFPWAV